jgi:hypothetical protein
MLIALAGLLSVLPIAADGQTPKRGGTLRVAYGNEILGMDFYTTPGYEMAWVAMNVGCGLVSISTDGKFIPRPPNPGRSRPTAFSTRSSSRRTSCSMTAARSTRLP